VPEGSAVVRAWAAPVRYAEIDGQGVVFNAHYLTWADEACTAWFAAVGIPYDALLARDLDMKVKASTLEWASSARYGDVVEVDARCERIGGTSWVLVLAVRVGERLCCTVRTTYVLVDGDGRPVRVPDDLRARWQAG
jgi:acyl-CoA thioester hydrolase